MTECAEIVSNLLSVVQRPEMYGNPENVEAIGMHSIHICLMSRDELWQWNSTYATWHQIASSNGFGEQFSEQVYESSTNRKRKWGNREHKASQQILQIYRSIWENLQKEDCDFDNAIAKWVKFLLNNPHDLGSPDNIDAVMWYLIATACHRCVDKFRNIYTQRCIELRGTGSRGFRDFGTLKSWQFVPYKGEVDAENHERVKHGLLLVLHSLKLIEQVSWSPRS